MLKTEKAVRYSLISFPALEWCLSLSLNLAPHIYTTCQQLSMQWLKETAHQSADRILMLGVVIIGMKTTERGRESGMVHLAGIRHSVSR